MLAVLLAAALPAYAQPFETKAQQAIMIDAGTGTVLFSKNADDLVPPASLAKLMTMELVFRAIKEGRQQLDSTFVVSENAWRKGGAPSGSSTMFAKPKSTLRLEDLIQGVVVQSANDGCIAIAEGMAGSEEAFAAMMTERARELGLPNSVFRNATGLPAEGQLVTMRELVALAMHIWREYPEFYRYYSQRDFTWNKITQKNRNPLLAMDIGADGMKTGYTEASGYAIVGAAASEGRRVFVAMSGMASERERAEEARKMLEWGLGSFRNEVLFADGETVGEAAVYGGVQPSVPLQAAGSVEVALPASPEDGVEALLAYDGPLMAPVEKGARAGTLRVMVAGAVVHETPLFAAAAVSRGSLHQRAFDAAGELLTGWLR